MEETEFLKIVNNRGEEFVLCPNYNEFGVLKLEGLEPPDVDVNISDSGTTDGGTWNSSHISSRNIVITMVLFGENEEERKKLYRMFPLKSVVTLYYRNTQYNVKTSGHIKNIDLVHYPTKELARIEIVCPDPYLHAADTITAEFSGNPPVCTIKNDSDVEIGITATVTIDTETHPDVTLTKSNPVELSSRFYFKSNIVLEPSSAADYNLTENKICELTIDDDDISNHISEIEKFVKKDSMEDEGITYLNVSIDSDLVSYPNYIVTYGIMSLSGGGSVAGITCTGNDTTKFEMSDVRYTSAANFGAIEYDNSKDAVRLYLKNSTGEWEYVSSGYTMESYNGDWRANFSQRDVRTDGTQKARLYVYHDTGETDIRSTLQVNAGHSGHRDGTEWYLHCYDAAPASYDASNDVAYTDGERIDGSSLATAIIIPDGGTSTTYSIIQNEIAQEVDFCYVSALDSSDITEYTDEQIEAGLYGQKYIHGLKLTNATTGKEMPFTQTRFQLGDVLEICTVQKKLKVAIVERDGETTDISVINEIVQSGDFINLAIGDNSLKFTATTNLDCVSAEISIDKLYGGV